MCISSIKSGTEVVEDLSLRRIKRRFRFCYHGIDIDTALVCYIELKTSEQNHSYLMISFLTIIICIILCVSLLSNQLEKWWKTFHHTKSSEGLYFSIIGELSIQCWYVR